VKYVLVLVVIVVFGWLMLRGHRRSKASGGKTSDGQAQPMIQCDHCGIHLPTSDAVRDQSGNYCCDAHKLAGPRTS
jgi:uncharacterized protein